MKSANLNRVAETHYLVRSKVELALKAMIIPPDVQQKLLPGCATYYDHWINSRSHHFFDMGTLIRAAASVETALRDFYMARMGHPNLVALRNDVESKVKGNPQNVFQRIMPWHGPDGAVTLFSTLGVELRQITRFREVQELVLHRHLYAHNLGVVDDKHIKNVKRLTGIDITLDADFPKEYPNEDVYWFKPLSRLPEFIESARTFLGGLPS